MIRQVINLSLSSEEMETARKRHADASKVCDEDLKEAAQHQDERRCRIIHTDFIHIYNKTLEVEGLPLALWQSF